MMDPAKVDARLDKLKTDLKLTSAQQGRLAALRQLCA